jgi:hypothetical protein
VGRGGHVVWHDVVVVVVADTCEIDDLRLDCGPPPVAAAGAGELNDLVRFFSSVTLSGQLPSARPYGWLLYGAFHTSHNN